MNIALINPLVKAVPNFGIMYIASYLRNYGHKVKLFEMLDYTNYLENNQKILDEIINLRFDLIGISCMSVDYNSTLEIIKYLKEHGCNAPLILGGRHPSFFYEECLRDGADFVCIGEGEELMSEFVKESEKSRPDFKNIRGLAYENNGVINFNGYREDFIDLNDLPMPAYDLVDYKTYTNFPTYGIKGRYIKTGWVFTSRGCFSRCIFCYNPTFQKKMRFRNIAAVIDEINYQIKKYHIKGLMIFDDIFNINEARVIEFCEQILEQHIKIEMCCEARVDTFNIKIAKYMKKAGFRQIGFGIESGSQRILDYLKKDVTIGQIEEAVNIAKECNLRVATNIIIGTPWEDASDIAKTINFIKRIRPDIVGVTFLTPYPGTELYEMVLKNKWIDDKVRHFAHGDEEPMIAVGFSREELKKFRDKIYDTVLLDIYRSLLASPKFLYEISKVIIKNPKSLYRIFKIWKQGTRNSLIKYIVRQLYISNFKLKEET